MSRVAKLSLLAVIVVAFILITPLRFEGLVTSKTANVYESPLFRYEVTQYPSSVNVVENEGEDPEFGFDTSTVAVTFGQIPPGSTANRYIDVGNTKDIPVKITLETAGKIAPYITFDQNHFTLNAQETRQVKITVAPTELTKPGEYTGEITITSIESKNSVGDVILPWL